MPDITCVRLHVSFFLGSDFDSSVPQTKLVSAVEPAPAIAEHMQGTPSNTHVHTQAVLVQMRKTVFYLLLFLLVK